jgi:eukaryotic-like serine/threonine-protein kinase
MSVMDAPESNKPIKQIGRYAIFQEIAAGGMATVHLARLAGPAGFSRVVAAKCLHPHLLLDAEFKRMFIDEARLAARIRHPNVVPTLDVVVQPNELFLVMEYVQGEALSFLRKAAKQQKEAIPAAICGAIMVGALQGLHAAHECKNEKGELLNIVHRDVSPQNILVGVDGVARVLDFGVAKAMQARQDTRPGTVKGKSAYMAPEQIRSEPLTRRADIFAASVVFWEILTTKRLFGGATEEERIYKVLHAKFPPPSVLAPGLPAGLDEVVMKGLNPNPEERYQSALEMAEAIEKTMTLASQRVIGEWVTRIGAESLGKRAEILKPVEISKIISVPPPSRPDPDGMQRLDNKLSQLEKEASVPGGVTNFGMGLSQDPSAPWWRDRRAIALGSAAGALGLLGIVMALRSGPGPAPAARPEAVAQPAPTPAPTPSGVSSAAVVPVNQEPPAQTAKPVFEPSPQPLAPHRAGQSPARPANRSPGARGFRPTEL